MCFDQMKPRLQPAEQERSIVWRVRVMHREMHGAAAGGALDLRRQRLDRA
jgi:hypothetical protein